MEINFELPEWAEPFFDAHRYKIAYGGRGSSKSWTFARILAWMAAQRPMRILCARETQKSIEESVHQVLTDQISQIGLADQFTVLNNEIRHNGTGSQFVYAGLKQHVIANIKSYEGFDACWIAEAHTVSKRSWDVLEPTIRKPGSEFWIDLNPELDTDETYDRFIVNPPENSLVVPVNWRDNPWFADELEAQRVRTKFRDPAGYENIWEGKPLSAVPGAIYSDQIIAAQAQKRIRSVPRDPTLPVHRIWDLGWNDAMAVILAQRVVSEVAIVGYVTGTHRTLAEYIADFRGDAYKGWVWGKDWLPHDGFAKRHQTGRTDEQVLTGIGCNVDKVPNMEIEQGIRQARLMFPRVYIDKENTKSDDPELPGLVECLKRYRRQINLATDNAGAPLHDKHSNGADAFRYLSLVVDQMGNEMTSKPMKINRGFVR